MKLVVMSNKPLSTFETWVEKMFSVPNNKLNNPNYDSEIFDKSELPRLVEVKPVKDYKLNLYFQSQSSDNF